MFSSVQQYPSRHPNHNLESKSELFLRNHLPVQWIMDKPTDYGIDFKIEIVLDGAVIGHNFSVQLKSHEKSAKGNRISITLERTTINLYLNRLEPLLLVCYIAEHHEAYYCWFNERSVDLTKKNESFTIHFNLEKKLSKLNWDDITDDVNKIFSRKFLLNALPEINFSEMNDDEKTAYAHYLNLNYEIAEQLFKKLNRQNPNGFWLNPIAMCQYSLYRYKEALSTINQALEKEESQDMWLDKAAILAEYGIEIKNKAMVLEASNIFKKAIDELGDAHQHFNYANTLTELGENQEAENHYKKALKLNPNHAEAWKNLGHIYSLYKNLTKEMQCYDNALAINPKLPQALMCKGISLIRDHKKFKEGISFLEKAIAAEPDLFTIYGSGYFWFSYAHFQTDDQENGLKYLQKGLNQYPGDPYLLNLKRDYFKKNWGKSDEIRKESKAFFLYRLELEPEDAISQECLCRIYLSEQDKLGAIELIRKHTVLFQRTGLDQLLAEEFSIEDYLSSLYSYQEYRYFRHQHPLEKDLNSKVSSAFYFEMNELIALKIFHDSLEYSKRHREEKQFEQNLMHVMLKEAALYYPKTAPYIITANVEQKELFGQQLSSAIVHIPILAMREVGRINGYLTIRLHLNEKKMNAAIKPYIEKTISQKILGDCLTEIQERFHFFPNN